ncbi:MAG: SDR family oxidoreductase [Gemmatimonadaceae bacterium]
MSTRLIMVTGVSGYVGGRLVRALRGRSLRCMARHPESVRARIPSEIEIVPGDVLDRASLDRALTGVDVAYYLVHSLAAGSAFEAQDREGALNFAESARAAGVRRIVYLGGLGEPSAALSSHLRSRQETGEALRSTGVPVIEFRASVVIGSGSLSFELIRALVERLPIMICPRWVSTPTQPIGIDDLIAYLVAAADIECDEHIFEIGGSEVSSFGDIMREYARQRGLRRYLISVPLLTPHLSSLWLGLVTPVYARVGKPLVEGMRNPTIVRDSTALARFAIRPVGLAEMIGRALRSEDREAAETLWTDAVCSSGTTTPWGGGRYGSRLVETHTRVTAKSPAQAFEPIRRIGGKAGWYYANILWRVRGLLDMWVGGPGLRRGRRHPEQPEVGGHIDWWRVEAFEPDHLLRLRAEMRLPGRAWLQFEVEPQGSGSIIRQTAIFDPLGLAGLVYWYGLYPIHRLIFAGMLRRIAAAS